MNTNLIVLSTCLLWILPTTSQTPVQGDSVHLSKEVPISFPKVTESLSESDRDSDDYLDDESEVDYSDELALHNFISDLKNKGDNPSKGVSTWKPDLESNNLWNFQSFLNELVTQARKEKPRKVRMPEM